jgi:chitinase
MGTYVVSMKVKRNAGGDGMYFSGTPVAVNAAGTFKTHRFVTGSAAAVVTLSTGVVDSPLNAGQINGVVAQPVSFVSVLATGGVADGTTDNMTAIAAAMSQAAALSHKTVLIPTGTFAYNGNLTISGVTVAGVGPSSILLAQNPSQRGIFLVGSSAQLKSVLLQNSATAFAAAVASVDYAGVVAKGSAFLVHNVYIDEVAGAGIDIANSADGVVLQNTLSGCKANAIIAHGGAHDLLVKLNFVQKATGTVGLIAATADAVQVVNSEWSYNWIKDNSGTATCMLIAGGRNASVHNNLCQSNSAHAGIVIAQDGALTDKANLSCSVEYNTIENCGRSSNNTAALLAYNTSITSVGVMVRRNRIIHTQAEPGIRAFGPHSATTLDNNQISAGVAYVDAPTAGVVTNLFAGGNAGYPFTTPGLGESPHNSTIPPLSELVDSNNVVWTLDANRTALRNGVATISNAIDLLLYWNRRVYQNTVNGWWVWDDNIVAPANGWVATTDPRVIQSTPPTFPALSRHPADFLQVGNPAIATYWIDDNRWGAAGISEGIGNAPSIPADGFPRRIVATYWEAYNSFNQSYVRIQNISTFYNVIFLFHCQFNGDGSPNFPWLSPSEVRAVDVQTCRNRGQKVILTVGGAGNGFQFTNRTLSNNFIAGIQTIISQLGGVDGLDFNNYEQLPPSQTTITEIKFIASSLKSIYGSQFAITTPPEPTDNTQYMELARQLDAQNTLTWVSPQYYDRTDVKAVDVIFNFTNRWISAVAQASQVVIGLGSGNYNTGAATTLAEANREVNRVLSAHPTIRGVFSWNANFDATQGFAFGSNFHNRFSAVDAAAGGNISAGAFTQVVERALTAGPEGQIAFKTQWSWPFSVNGVTVDGGPFSEVKAFPSIIYGARPGYRASGAYPAFEKAVRLPDGVTVTSPPANAPQAVASNWVAAGGSVSTVAPSGATNSNLPRQLLISAGTLIVTGRLSASATGKAHVSCDVWLQAPANPTQTAGFMNSPITHEIMVPLKNFGGYGAHGNRGQTHTHDVVIEGVNYHVYAAMSTNGALLYSFGGLNPNYINEETGSGRTGWKFIVFQHDGTAHPLLADGSFRINLGAMINHCRTRVDSRGIAWVQGTEHAVAVEIGVEPVVGQGECIIWDYKVV